MIFDPENYSNELLESGGTMLKHRAYTNIPYAKQPVFPELQVLNIYIPQIYIDNGCKKV
ncbi:MAG: hypothetical protein IJZ72_09835 [Oscillospiraceae bacterium]|nr:hypothetical protein [Oscillospiraceae bacterium]